MSRLRRVDARPAWQMRIDRGTDMPTPISARRPAAATRFTAGISATRSPDRWRRRSGVHVTRSDGGARRSRARSLSDGAGADDETVMIVEMPFEGSDSARGTICSSHKPTSKSRNRHRLSPCRPCPKTKSVRQSISWRNTETVAVRPNLCGIASPAARASRNSPFRRRTRRRSAWRRAHPAHRRARRACAPPTHRSQRAPPG